MIVGRVSVGIRKAQNLCLKALLILIAMMISLSSGILSSLPLHPIVHAAGEVTPYLTCWESTPYNNLVKLYYGYHNADTNAITIPQGVDNAFSPLPINRNQPIVFSPGTHEKVFFVEVAFGSEISWTLGGITVNATYSEANRCPAPAISTSTITFINSPKYVIPSTSGILTEIETYDTTSQVRFVVDGDTENPIIISDPHGPSRPGFAVWRLEGSVGPGAHTISAQVFIQGYWFDVSGISGVYADESQSISFIVPSTEKYQFNPMVSPVTIQADDTFNKFDRVYFTLRNAAITKNFVVNRSQCDTSESGTTVRCSITEATDWIELEPGTYTVSAQAYSKTGVQSSIIDSHDFLIDSTAPQVSALSILGENAYRTYSGHITAQVLATDPDDESGIKRVNFIIRQATLLNENSICDGSGGVVLQQDALFQNGVYTGGFEIASLQGTYCLYAKAEDRAGNISNEEVLQIDIQNTKLAAPTILGWNSKSISNDITKRTIDIPCDPNGVYVNSSGNTISQHWDSISGKNIKYIRRLSLDNGISWQVDETEVYSHPYMNTWLNLDIEGSYLMSVLAFDDLNENDLIDDGEVFISDWGPACKITYDTTSPQLAEKEGISSPSKNENLTYTFVLNDNAFDFSGNENDVYTITYSGVCTSSTHFAMNGDNTILFDPLSDGLYDDCEILITDKASNISEVLKISPFIVDNTKPVVTEEEPIPSLSNSKSPPYKITSNEAGILIVDGGCSTLQTFISPGENTIVLNSLADGFYNTCTVQVVDSAGNVSDILQITPFTVDTVAPIVSFSLIPNTTLLRGNFSISGTASDLHPSEYLLQIKQGPNVVWGPAAERFIGTHTFSWNIDSKQFTDGLYTISLRARDSAGNIRSEQTREIEIDNTGPVVNPLASKIINEGDRFTFDITAADPNQATLVIQYRYTDSIGNATGWIPWGSVTGKEISKNTYNFFPHLKDVIFDSSSGGTWQEGVYEYRYVLRDSLGNYSNSGYSTYNFIEGVNAFYTKLTFQNVPPKVSLSLFTTGSIIEGITPVEFYSSFSDQGYIPSLHSSMDPERDIDFMPPAGDAPWFVQINYGDGTIYSYFDNDDLKMWQPGDIIIPNHIYKKHGTYTVTVTVTESLVIAGGSIIPSGGAHGFAQLRVVVENMHPTVNIISGIANETLFAYVTGGNAPYTFKWDGACSGYGQASKYPSLAGEYICTVTVVDADGDVSVASFEFTIHSDQDIPVGKTIIGAITPEAAYTVNNPVLGSSDVKLDTGTNSYNIFANSGTTVTLHSNKGMCASFEELSFKTLTGINGKIFIYQINKDTYKHLPFDNKKLLFDICEIQLDGFSNADITDIVIKTKFTTSWLTENKLNENDVVFYTSKTKNTYFTDKLALEKRTNSANDVVHFSTKLTHLPLVYSVGASSEFIKSHKHITWWITGIIISGTVLTSFVVLLRRKYGKKAHS